ncbi:MAG TPA: 8-amino-7-oxononanoate synthase [Blastocatellia bacterium]|nr:8-amino-7-oxononanoate synthase [Blastocatellia bacterium]
MHRRLTSPAGIDLSSNDYLGLADHPLLKQAMAEAVTEEGCGATGSRLLRGERPAFDSVERLFAEFKGTEAALYFSSGYLANIAVLSTFLERDDVVFSDERNHASLIDGIRLAPARRIIFPHCDTAQLARLLRTEQGPGKKFLVTETLFGMDGDFAPLAQYANLCRETGTVLVLDEAHAVGVYGRSGSGFVEEAFAENPSASDSVFLSINSAGKALGVCGAFVAGPRLAIDYLIQRARPFIFSTAPVPATTAAIAVALQLAGHGLEQRRRLRLLSSHLRKRLCDAGIEVSPAGSHIIPVVLGSNDHAMAVATAVQTAGFDVRAIRPPTVPQGTARLRISLNTKVTEQELDLFAQALSAAMKSVKAVAAG